MSITTTFVTWKVNEQEGILYLTYPAELRASSVRAKVPRGWPPALTAEISHVALARFLGSPVWYLGPAVQVVVMSRFTLYNLQIDELVPQIRLDIQRCHRNGLHSSAMGSEAPFRPSGLHSHQ